MEGFNTAERNTFYDFFLAWLSAAEGLNWVCRKKCTFEQPTNSYK